MSVTLVLPNRGTYPNDRTGDALRQVVDKYNAAFLALAAAVNNPANIDPASALTIASLTANLFLNVGTLPLTQFYDATNLLTPTAQQNGTTADGARWGASLYNAGSVAPGFSAFHSVSTNPAVRIPTPVGTRLGLVSFAGEDATRMVEACRMMAVTTALPTNSQIAADIVYFGGASGTFTEYLRITSNGSIYAADAVASLGLSNRRWTTVYATTSTISTSDERVKDWRGALTDAELRAAKTIARDIGVYQFKDAVAAKGADHARLHTGVRAQEVIAALTAEGLQPMRYAFVCYDVWEAKAEEKDADTGEILAPAQAAGDRYSIRYEELAMFIAAAQEARLSVIEG